MRGRADGESDGVDVVLDIVGGDYVRANLECLELNGRLVQIGLIGGARRRSTLCAAAAAPADADRLDAAAAFASGKGRDRRRPPDERLAAPRAAGRSRPIVDRSFPLEDAADAHRALESGEVIGKLVLTAGA